MKQKFLKAKQKVDEVTNVGLTKSLTQGVTHIRDITIGHGHRVSVRKVDKTKKKRRRRDKDGSGHGSGDQDSAGEGRDKQSGESDESGRDSDAGTDSDQSMDDEAKKAKEQYLQEIKETKLREARKILFGDFAVM